MSKLSEYEENVKTFETVVRWVGKIVGTVGIFLVVWFGLTPAPALTLERIRMLVMCGGTILLGIGGYIEGFEAGVERERKFLKSEGIIEP